VSDTQLRELERRYQASGTMADEAAWLRARCQADVLSEDRLLLAAYAGSEAAAAALETPPTEPSQAAVTWVKGLRGLLGYEAELTGAAIRLCAWLSLEWTHASEPEPVGWAASLQEALRLIGAAWEFPTERLRESARAALRGPVFSDGDVTPQLETRRLRAFHRAFRAVFARDATVQHTNAVEAAVLAARAAGEGPVLSSLQRATREWALGYARPQPEELIVPRESSGRDR